MKQSQHSKKTALSQAERDLASRLIAERAKILKRMKEMDAALMASYVLPFGTTIGGSSITAD
jgi:hypothetical protein